MSITAALFLLFYFAGLSAAIFRDPRFGLYTYLFAFYMHPPDRWWRNDVPDLRWSLIAAVVTILVVLVRPPALTGPKRPSWVQTNAGKFFVAYIVLMLAQYPVVVTGKFHTEGVELFIKYGILSYLIYKLIDTRRDLLRFAICHVLGCFYMGWLAFGKNISGRFEGIGGPGIDDANTFAMYMATAILFAAALLLKGPLRLRSLIICVIPFIINGFIVTQSRGGFVALAVASLALLLFKPRAKSLLFYSLAGCAVGGFLALSPPEFLDRLRTITVAVEDTEAADGSVGTRIALAKAQIQMVSDYPLGAGHRGTRILSTRYLAREHLTTNQHGEGAARSSHNTYLAVLVDQGPLGLLLYAWLILGSFWILRKTLKLNRNPDRREEQYELECYRMGLAGALTVIATAGMFSNYLKAEVFVWTVSLILVLKNLFAQQNEPLESERSIDNVQPKDRLRARTTSSLRKRRPG